MDDADINPEIETPAWFGVDQHPEAKFFSDYIITSEEGFQAEGYLELKGIQRKVTVPFTFTPNEMGVLMEGRVTLDRGEFNVGSGTWAEDETIGFDVTVAFTVQLVRVG